MTQTKELKDAAQSALKDVDSESVFWFNDEGFYKSYPSDADIEIGFYRIPIDQLVTEFENSGMKSKSSLKTICPTKAGTMSSGTIKTFAKLG